MTTLEVNNTWQQITVPCVFQVQGARIAIYFGETLPNDGSPEVILQNFDFWEHNTSMPLYVKTLESFPNNKSTIIISPIP